jgi:hypothetical protein
MRYVKITRADELSRVLLLIGRSAAKAQACSRELQRDRIKPSLVASFSQAASDGMEEFSAPFVAGCVIARAAAAAPRNTTEFITNQSSGAGLPTINAKVIMSQSQLASQRMSCRTLQSLLKKHWNQRSLAVAARKVMAL